MTGFQLHVGTKPQWAEQLSLDVIANVSFSRRALEIKHDGPQSKVWSIGYKDMMTFRLDAMQALTPSPRRT